MADEGHKGQHFVLTTERTREVKIKTQNTDAEFIIVRSLKIGHLVLTFEAIKVR